MAVSVPDSGLGDQLAAMRRFRQAVYGCFTRWPDTLFEMIDALLCRSGRLESLPYLTLEPELRRGHGSVYAALATGQVDTDALGRVLASAIQPEFGLVFAVDASGWPRPDAEHTAERTMNYDARKDTGGRSRCVTAGWEYQWLTQLGPSGTSWAVPIDVRRIAAQDNDTLVAVEQITTLLGHLRAHRIAGTAIVALDGGYSAATLAARLADQPVQLIVRVRKDGVFYGDPPAPKAATTGRPRRHGHRMKLSDPTTWPTPEETLEVPADTQHPALTVTRWHHQHPRPSRQHNTPGNDLTRNTNRPIVRGHLIHIQSANPRHQPLWLWWTGPADSVDLDRVWRAYLRRYGIEHFFRFGKQHLAWTLPRPLTAAQADRWTWLVASAYTHLILARTHTTHQPLPWQRHRPTSPLTVKQGFRRLRHHLGTPTKPRQPHQPGPGRPPRHPNQHKHPHHPPTKKTPG